MSLKRNNMQNSSQNQTVNYNEEPVFYCSNCLSLKVKNLGDDSEICYCDNCGSTEIDTTDIYSWKALYKEKYGKEY